MQNVNYVSVSENNNSNDLFSLSFNEYEKIEKTSLLNYEKDTDKPEVLHNIDTIGYNLISNDSYAQLFRHAGKFRPSRRNIVDFCMNETPEFITAVNKDLLSCNTSINTMTDTGIIKNHFYNKVNATEILKIASGSSYKSMYPFVNEIAIDKKDTNIFKSSWDGTYYINHTSPSDFNYVDGMQDFNETKSFMGTTVMNVPTSYEFYSFNSDEYLVSSVVPTGANVSTLNNTGTVSAIDSGKNAIDITFKISDRLIRDAINNDAKKELDWISQNVTNAVVSNMNDTQKNDYIKKYLQTNILELYTTLNITVYAKPITKGSETYPLNLDTYESKLINTGYTKYNSFTVTKINELDFAIRIFIDTTKYQMFSVGVQVKRI
jgi:hypothetical protein